MDISEKTYGEMHQETATAYHNIAFLFGIQGEYGKVLGWYQKVLAFCEKVLGEEH